MEAGNNPEPLWLGPHKDVATAYQAAIRGDAYIMDGKTKAELTREQAAVGAVAEKARQPDVEAQAYWSNVASGASSSRATGAVESQNLTQPSGRTL